jgi:hypothetical protein
VSAVAQISEVAQERRRGKGGLRPDHAVSVSFRAPAHIRAVADRLRERRAAQAVASAWPCTAA